MQIGNQNWPYTNIDVVGESLRVASQPYTYSIVEGDVTGHTAWFKAGQASTNITFAMRGWLE